MWVHSRNAVGTSVSADAVALDSAWKLGWPGWVVLGKLGSSFLETPVPEPWLEASAPRHASGSDSEHTSRPHKRAEHDLLT